MYSTDCPLWAKLGDIRYFHAKIMTQLLKCSIIHHCHWKYALIISSKNKKKKKKKFNMLERARWIHLACSYWLTFILLTWRIRWAPNNASKWQMGFNLAFKGLISQHVTWSLFRRVTYFTESPNHIQPSTVQFPCVSSEFSLQNCGGVRYFETLTENHHIQLYWND
jgi:hypothetical protein